MQRALFAFLLVAFSGCEANESAGEATTNPPDARSEEPVLVIERHQGRGMRLVRPTGSASPAERVDELPVAVWGDGRLIWRGSEGMLEGRVDPSAVVALIDRLDRLGAFGTGSVYERHFGPDSGYVVVDLHAGDRRLRYESWHESAEGSERVVATARGLEVLEGRERDKVLAEQPDGYRRFLRAWSEIRTTARGWIPSSGTPYEGVWPIPTTR